MQKQNTKLAKLDKSTAAGAIMALLANSQDGRPVKAMEKSLLGLIEDQQTGGEGRTTHLTVSDRINELISGSALRAVLDGDLSLMVDDLQYAAAQLKAAAHAATLIDEDTLEHLITQAQDIERTRKLSNIPVIFDKSLTGANLQPGHFTCATRLRIGRRTYSLGGWTKDGEGRIVQDGEKVKGPYLYAFINASVLDNHGGSGAINDRDAKAGLLLEAHIGDWIGVAGDQWQIMADNNDNIRFEKAAF